MEGVTLETDPVTYRQAMNSPYSEFWKAAMKEEWDSLIKNHTWEDMDSLLQHNTHAIRSRWVFKTKFNLDKSIRFKARLVIKGYQQLQGIDFLETFAPVSKITTLRLLISIAGHFGWQIDQMDVITAFLNPDIDKKDVHMQLPEGTEWLDPNRTGRLVTLKKALYGLKQAPRLWYQNIDSFLVSLGLKQSTADSNLYINEETLLLLYVDDILLFYHPITGQTAIRTIKLALSTKYQMTDLGIARKFLGLEIDRDENGGYYLSQRQYVNDIIKRFHLEEAKPALTPMDHHTDLDAVENDKECNRPLYLSMIGCLMYAAISTRPDISFCVTRLSRYNVRPFNTHMTAAIRCFRYLKHTKDFRLCYPKLSQLKMTGYTDSDWAGNTKDRKSMGAFVFCIGNTAISWQSKKQEITAVSTQEAEYMAYLEAGREAIWLRRLYTDIITRMKDPELFELSTTTILSDNQGALATVKNGAYMARTKHIDVKYHRARDFQNSGVIDYSYVNTKDNSADVFTKALPTSTHERIISRMGLCKITDEMLR
jgi:hypothetical protein